MNFLRTSLTTELAKDKISLPVAFPLDKITKECKEDEIIVTAHHLDDQIETFFLRVLRGSASRGLSDIKSLSIMYFISNLLILLNQLSLRAADFPRSCF